MIGFATDHKTTAANLYGSKYPYYILNCYNGLTAGPTRFTANEYLGHQELKNGDTICMEFNVDGDKSFIKFHVNNVDKGIAFQAIDIDVTYRFAVSLCYFGDCFTLANFECD